MPLTFSIRLPNGTVNEETRSSTVAGAWTNLLKLNPSLHSFSERKLKEMGYSVKRENNDLK